MNLLNKQLIIVTGKGGVGKSTIAAALAIKAAKSKKNVLLVELGEESFYAPFFGLDSVEHQPKVVQPYGFRLALWDTESCLKEYVLHYIKVEGIFKLFFENKVMRTFMNVAPTLKELAILGKFTSGKRQIGPPFHYDLVVLDAYASGHMLSLLRAPKGVSEVIKSGPMGVQSASIYKTLVDESITGFVVVTLPDEMPTVEALELTQSLKDEFDLKPEIVVNRRIKPPASVEEIEKLRLKVKETTGLGSFLRYLTSVVKRQESNVRRLKDSGSRVYEVPLAYAAMDGRNTAEIIAQEIEL